MSTRNPYITSVVFREEQRPVAIRLVDVKAAEPKLLQDPPATPEMATPAPVSDPPVEDVRETAVADPQLNDQIRELLEVILERVEQLEDNRRQSLQEMQTVAVELGVAAAAYILNQQVAADEFRLLPLIEEAVQRLSPYEDITVQLNPEDHQALVRANPEQVSAIEAKATVVTDPRAQRGTVVVKSGDQGWMSSFEERLGARPRELTEWNRLCSD